MKARKASLEMIGVPLVEHGVIKRAGYYRADEVWYPYREPRTGC